MDDNKKENIIVFIAGGGGAGKSSICDTLTSKHSDWTEAISYTTRKQRKDEPDNYYNFVEDIAEFHNLCNNNTIVNFTYLFDNYYGTPDLSTYDESVVLHIISSDAILGLQKIYPNSISLWVDAPSLKDNEERMLKRGDKQEHVDFRIKKIPLERSIAIESNASVVVNGDLNTCIKEVERLIDTKMKWD